MLDPKNVYKQFIATPGKKVSLKKVKTSLPSIERLSDEEIKKQAKALLEKDVELLADAQERLYASDTWSVLLIFQAMDAAGKDTTIKHVMSGVNPQGCQVFSFKHPSAEDLDHNFLWRYNKALPERGRIGIFNRSYYEEALIVRVHETILESQRIPKLETKSQKQVWNDRFRDINNLEQHLSDNGTLILKFFLHLSKEEQKTRFLQRLDDKSKNWKFSTADISERKHWPKYMMAYEEVISNTSTKHAPWFIIPADRKWVARAITAKIISHAMGKLTLNYPKISKKQKRELSLARAELLKEK